MATSLLFCEIKRFPKLEQVSVPFQTTIDGVEENGETYFTLRQNNFHLGFDRYQAHHDHKVKAFGKVYGRSFHHYLSPCDFPLYVDRQRAILVIQAARDVAMDFLDVAGSHLYNLEVGPYAIDVAKVMPMVHEISGIWVANLGEQYLKTAGYFGTHVNRSDELQGKLKVGSVSTIMLRYSNGPRGEEAKVGISKYGNIIIYPSFELPEHVLQLAVEIFERYVLPTDPKPGFPSQTKRGSSKHDDEGIESLLPIP